MSERVVTGPDGPQVLAAGRLIVASPLLPDPNFDRTVVLLIAYSEDGALGLVLNRPSATSVSSPLPEWAALAAQPAVVFVGGPVQHQAVICLARPVDGLDLGGQGGSEPAWRPVAGDIGTLDLESDPGAAEAGLTSLRIFAGYAGWAAGQLDTEVEAGAWWAVDAEAGDPFTEEPEDLWKSVLRRQRGGLRLAAWFPSDPRWN